MLSINGKKFMNISEAVQWLLNNNALPFQCKVNFVADTEISKTDIINPAPAELKIGSLVLFADGLVGTVNAITSNGFKVGSEYTDLSDGVPHITGISIDASQHLIFTMSEGDPIDAGLIKEVSSMSIDASQHLIVNYNDGTTNDLGAIFQGNVNIAGNFTADSIIENMSGYSFSKIENANLTKEILYAGVVKNGNKLTFCIFAKLTRTGNVEGTFCNYGSFGIPASVGERLYPYSGQWLEAKKVYLSNGYSAGTEAYGLVFKDGDTKVYFNIYGINALALDTEYVVRFETTFLLSQNLAS